MHQAELEAFLTKHVETDACNHIDAGDGNACRVYTAPLMGYAAADDPIFDQFQAESIIGPHHWKPKDWLGSAKTVVSFFLPFSNTVRRTNTLDPVWPSLSWLYARIEGQQYLVKLCHDLADALQRAGYAAVVPCTDARFAASSGPTLFTSNWSERHAAYAAGLGTFSLTRGLITKKGVAGRFGSVITDLSIPATERPYDNPYAYCIRCGKCIARCPVQAISLEHGKDQAACSTFLDETKRIYAPRYGCGKC